MKFNVELTWSKLIALVALVLAFILGSNVFMFTMPFVVFLITGKQITDAVKK